MALRLCSRCQRQLWLGSSRRSISKGSDASSPRTGGSYFSRLKWVPIPVSVGLAYIAYQQYRHVVKREERKLNTFSNPEQLLANDWTVTFYKCLPLKIMSRIWGKLNNKDLPEFLRSSLLRWYIRAFNCNMEEATMKEVDQYRNLSELFNRRLKPGARHVDLRSSLVCPSDGKVLHLGRAERGLVEQVKGITYSLQDLIGPIQFEGAGGKDRVEKLSRDVYHERLKRGTGDTHLFHCVIYLAPGDYHGFHSPTEWTIHHRRHFPGELLSVSPGICRLVRGLFNLNERAVYLGNWAHGFFAMVPVAATNVGNIRVFHDKALETNMPYRYPAGAFFDHSFHSSDVKGIYMARGDAFGEFRLGSTIVLVFEAPRDFRFEVEPGQSVKYGQPLGRVHSEEPRDQNKG